METKKVYLHKYHVMEPTKVVSEKPFSEYRKKFMYPVYDAGVDEKIEVEVFKNKYCHECGQRGITKYRCTEVKTTLKDIKVRVVYTSCGCWWYEKVKEKK